MKVIVENADRSLDQKEMMKNNLSLLQIDALAIITEVKGEGPIRRRLLEMGLTPNTKVKMIKRAPLGDPIEIQIRNYNLTLRLEDAKNILIKELDI